MNNLSLAQRVQEWLADRVSWIQYPNVSIVRSKLPFWRYEFRPMTRFFFSLFFIFWIIVFSMVLIAMVIVLWAFITSLLGY
jgi:hypothetical protein